DRGMPLRWIVGIRNGAGCSPILGKPLVRTGWALSELPLIGEQVFQIVVVPLHRVSSPCALQPAADRIDPAAVAVTVLPTQTWVCDACGLRIGTDIAARIRSPVSFAERVPAGDERNGLLVIHRHAAERLPDVPCRGNWIRLLVGTF